MVCYYKRIRMTW